MLIKSSVRKNIILSFSLILILGGITTNLFFLFIIRDMLALEGLDPLFIQSATSHLAIVGGGVTVVGIMGVLCVAFLISRSITRPIADLSHGVNELAKGHWDTRIRVKNTNEIGQLAECFNFMAQNVEDALQQLKAAKDYTDNIVVSVPSILIILSEKMNVLSTNIAFENLSEQFPTLSLKQFINPLEEEIRTNLETGRTLKKEIVISPEDSKVRLFFSATISSIGYEEDDLDDTARTLLTITDITERRKMKEMFLQSKQDWEDTFNTIPDAITIHDQDYNIIYANMAAREMLDLSNLLSEGPKKCYQYYHGKEAAPVDCPSCACLHTKVPVTFETYEPHLEKFIELRSIPRINGNGNVVGLIHIVRDISERKRIEREHDKLLEAVTKAKLEWEMTFDSVNEFILFIDKDLHITRCNKSFSRYAGLPAEELTGFKCHDFFPCSIEFFDKLINNIENNNQDTLFTKKEVKTESGKWLYMSHRPVFDEQNNYTFSVILATDITELKRAQERVEESEEELKIKIKDLEKFYDMAVGRELRMRELKKEIKRLNAALSNYEEQDIVNRRN